MIKIYKTTSGILLERNAEFILIKNLDWDEYVNDDGLFEKLKNESGEEVSEQQLKSLISSGVLAPIQNQEVWASGVTYYSSKLGRQEESKDAGGGSFYAHVYEAERPEIFFKSTPHRVVGPNDQVRIRKDSSWDAPEPELTLFISSSGKILGYTIGNDMSSRSIEGENPLYLPQAKSYDGSAALGPCILVTDQPLDKQTKIHMSIERGGEEVFTGTVGIDQIKRSFEELAGFLYRECSFPLGSFLMTGTGIVPGSDFTLQSGDHITIQIDGIGVLQNAVA